MNVSTFFGMNIAVNALNALQEAQGVVSNNIANSNTPGYVQESTQFTEAQPFPSVNDASAQGQISQGVLVSSVQRQTSAFLNQQDRINQGSLQMFQTHTTILNQIQATLNEPSANSIQSTMDQFFTAWQTLATDPSSTAGRQGVITQAQMLAQTFGTVTSQLEQLQGSLQNVVMGNAPQYTLSSTGTIDSATLLSQTPGQYLLQYTGTGSTLALQLERQDGTPIGTSVSVTGTGPTVIGLSGSGPMLSVDVSSLSGTGNLSLTPNTAQYADLTGQGVISGSATAVSPAQPPVPILSGTAQQLSTPTFPQPPYQVQIIATGTATSPTYSLQLIDASSNLPVGPAVAVTSSSSPVTIGSTSGTQFSVSLSNLTTLYSGTLASGTTFSQIDSLTPPLPGGQVGELNHYATQLYQLNRQIQRLGGAGGSANTLLDQQSLILDKMSKIANIKYSHSADHVVSVSLGGKTLVSGTSATSPLTYTDLAQLADLSTNSSGWSVNSGSMAGNLQGIQDTQNLLSKFDSFLNTLATQVNSIQTSGYPLTGTAQPPQLLTVSKDSSGHISLSVPSTFSPNQVGASSQPNQSGNRDNALRMMQLQSALTYNGGTFDQGLGQIVSQVGIEGNAAQAAQNTASSLAQQSSNLRQSVSGVDINQQAALMVEYQNSYNAAAKFISVFNQMLQTLISNV